MPASVSSSTVAPSASAAISPGSRAFSTDSWKVTTRPVNVTPRSEASRCSRRVSSTASTSAEAITSRSRGPTSPGCPRGAPPSTSRPRHVGEPVTAGRRPVHLPWRHGGAGTRAGGAGTRTRRRPAGPAAGPLPRPRRDRTPPLPDDAPAVLAAHRGARACVSLVSRLWGISYPRDLLFDEAYYPPEAARAADLGLRVQPRLLVHRPPAAGQVADRGRRAAVRLQLLRLAVPVARWPARSPSSSSSGWRGG